MEAAYPIGHLSDPEEAQDAASGDYAPGAAARVSAGPAPATATAIATATAAPISASASASAAAASAAARVAEMRPALFAFFQRRCRNAAEAEDLAQDVVLRALTQGEALSSARAGGYIFRIAVNRWRDRGRRLMTHGSSLPWEDAAETGLIDDRSPERVVGAEQELRNVARALGELGERTRDVLVRCRIDHSKQADIARSMGISVSSVEKHLMRALSHLAKHAETHRSGL